MMPEKLKRWDEGSQAWIEVVDVNRIEWMPPREDYSPKMTSAYNSDYTHTVITFDKPLLPFIGGDHIDAFYILAEWYWVQTVYPVTAIELIDTVTVRLTHGDISDADGTIRVAYDESAGSIRGENGYLALSHFFKYFGTYDYIKVRIRDTFSDNLSVLGLLDVTLAYSEATASIDSQIPQGSSYSDTFSDTVGVLEGLVSVSTPFSDSSVVTEFN